jgi:tetraacyldisaccharide 4'-kinase
LTALSAVYGRVARMRRAWYERRPHARRRLACPVISVGNLTVGGSGKTPVVAALARMLLLAGERPAILSRGYARREPVDGVVLVSDGASVLETVERSGDEPHMLARTVPGAAVVVCPDRFLAGRVAERVCGATVHILDDGFQHFQLARDVDLLLVRQADVDDHVLPAGRLREPAAAARAADALLVTGESSDVEEVAAALGVGTAFRVEPRYGAPVWLTPPPVVGRDEPGVGRDSEAAPASDDRDVSRGPEEAPAPAPGTRIVAVAGIARPQRFFGALRELGWDVAREMAFPDHHWFTAKDFAAIGAAVREAGASAAMTTEKDAVRLEGFVTGCRSGSDDANDTRCRIAVLPMDVAIEPADAFERWLLDKVRGAR